MAAVATLTSKWDDSKILNVVGTIALTGNYATGGISLDFEDIVTTKPGVVALPGVSKQPIGPVDIKGIAGYLYEYDLANKKLLIRQSAGFTPAGTVAAPVFTGDPLATHVHDLRVIGGQAAAGTDAVQASQADLILGKEEATDAVIAGADQATKGGVVPVTAGTPSGTNSAPAFTGTAVAAAPFAELAAAGLPAGVTGDTITFFVRFPKV